MERNRYTSGANAFCVLLGLAASAAEPVHLTMAPVKPENPRNSEAAIMPFLDGGLLLDWTDPAPSDFKGTAAPISLSRVPSRGDLPAIWNGGYRTPLTASLSKDEGKTWGSFRNIEEVNQGQTRMALN